MRTERTYLREQPGSHAPSREEFDIAHIAELTQSPDRLAASAQCQNANRPAMRIGTGKDQDVERSIVAQPSYVRSLSILLLQLGATRVDRAARGNDLGNTTVSDLVLGGKR